MPVQIVKLLDNPVTLNISGGITYLGEYDNATAYTIGNAVYYNGSSYVAIGDTTGNLPTNITYWQLLAEKGNAGTDGTNGTDGDDGIGIVSITKTNTVGLVDTYTITYTDSSTSTFDVTNGAKGDKGDKGDDGDPAPSDHTLLSNIGGNTHAEIDTHIASGELHEATGFDRPTVPNIAFDDSTRVFTITGPFSYYYDGQLVTKTEDETVTVPDTDGLWFIYYGANGVLTASQTAWNIFNTVQVATIYWNGSAGTLGDERHGIKMDRATHDYLHRTIGCRYGSGLGGAFTDTTITISSGQWFDEDITHETEADTTNVQVFYRNGTTWNWTAGQAKYYHEVSNIIQYDNSGTLTDVDNNKYVAYWIYATNHTDYPIISLMGQRQDTLLSSARTNNTPESIVFGSLPFPEMKLLYRVIVRRNGTAEVYTEALDYRAVSTVSTGNYVATDHNTLSNRNAANSHPALAIAPDTTNFAGKLSVADDTVQKALDTLDDHNHDGSYAAPLGADDNYVTDAEKSALHSHANKVALDAVSGTNTGDETQSTIKTKLGAATASVDGYATSTQITKLDGIEAGAEVNNISDINATDLTDSGATTLHKHSYNNLDDKPTIPTLPAIATGAEVDTGTDNAKMVTAKAIEDSSYAKTSAIPVKATGAEVDTGTDDAKFVTAKAVADSTIAKKSGATFTGAVVTADHGTATNPEVVSVVYGTTTPPTANTTPIGTIFIKYTA